MITIKNKHKDETTHNDIYIGRGTPVGNPWSHMEGTQAKFKVKTREESIALYKPWLDKQLICGNPQVSDFIRDLVIDNLKGEDIGLLCFCKPLSCHGDYIKKKVEGMRWVPNWFSNMKPFEVPLEHQGIKYLTPENFYQAMKLPIDDIQGRASLAAVGPHRSKKLVREFPLREDWNDGLARDVMFYALKRKFHLGSAWRQKLDSTKGPIIEYNNWRDEEWGVNIFTGEGCNWLGEMLTLIRDK